MDYQREKGEITADVDKLETEHLQEVRRIKDKIIETEVDIKRARADCEREMSTIEREQQSQVTRLGEWQIEKKKIQQEHSNFIKESA